LTFVVLLGLFVLMLVHSAHRFRYTLYDGLQIKKKRTVAVLCYGAALAGSVAALTALWLAT
jgi:fumarate reductase subunit D